MCFAKGSELHEELMDSASGTRKTSHRKIAVVTLVTLRRHGTRARAGFMLGDAYNRRARLGGRLCFLFPVLIEAGSYISVPFLI